MNPASDSAAPLPPPIAADIPPDSDLAIPVARTRFSNTRPLLFGLLAVGAIA